MKSENTRSSANATVALTAAALVALLGMVTAPATFAEDVPFTFLVPVVLENLHPDITHLTVRCFVSRADGGPFASATNVLGDENSIRIETELAGDVRRFSGDVRVDILLRPRQADIAQSYACTLSLSGRPDGSTAWFGLDESSICCEGRVTFRDEYAADRSEPFVMTTGFQLLP